MTTCRLKHLIVNCGEGYIQPPMQMRKHSWHHQGVHYFREAHSSSCGRDAMKVFFRDFSPTLLLAVCVTGHLKAQALKDLEMPSTPLVLKAQGSFFVGGEKIKQTQGELGNLGPGGHITVNQMYVRYMVPQGGEGKPPVVMVHGATLTGKTWETTPDGRMGWDEYFVRKGHPVYVPDQVGRGRSGFNQAIYNNVRAGSAPANTLPRWLRFSDRSEERRVGK